MIKRKAKIFCGIFTLGICLYNLILVPGTVAQELNPPYPRLGVFTFSGMTRASVDILKNFDVVTIGLDNDLARRYKEASPNRIVLRNTNLAAYNLSREISEKWRAKKANGQYLELWRGAYIMNVTKYCPKVDVGHGPETFVDWLVRWYSETIDFSVYDGLMYDWWWASLSQGSKEVDFNGNGVPDANEMDVQALWRESLAELHRRETQIPGLDYVVVQIGEKWVAPYVNGADYEDWPDFHGQWIYWKEHHMEQAWEKNPAARKPQLIFLDAAHTQFVKYGLGTDPYKNNYRAVRFALGSALLGSSFFFVDEGNNLGHHGNHHYYDEMEGKGMLGYPLTDGMLLPGKPKAGSPLCTGVWVRFFDNGVSLVNVSGVDQAISDADLAALDPRGGGSYYRILGGQDPVFNNGRKVTAADPLKLWGTTVKRHWPDQDPVGDGTMLFRSPKTLIAPIVVDNTVNNQTSPGSDPVQLQGIWSEQTDNGEYFYAYYKNRDYKVFQNILFALTDPGSGDSRAVYTPTIGVPGFYEVYEWHGYAGPTEGAISEGTNVPFIIKHADGETTKMVNQSVRYGMWNSLGTYFFPAGKSGSATITNQANGMVIADAVKFEFRGLDKNRDSIPPNPPQGVKAQEKKN